MTWLHELGNSHRLHVSSFEEFFGIVPDERAGEVAADYTPACSMRHIRIRGVVDEITDTYELCSECAVINAREVLK